MFRLIKKKIYFFVAYYFRFFAQIQLNRWKPRVIVITGSSGKTTLLQLLESQLGEKAKYSHHANSTFGIPFDILGLRRDKLQVQEWIFLFLKAPFMAFRKPFKQKLYVVEADCDRPAEGQFLSTLLKPEVTLWVNSSRTHAVNFDYLVANKKFARVEDAIAFEFGYFLAETNSLAIVNGDSETISSQLQRTKARIIKVTKDELSDYKVTGTGTEFVLEQSSFKFNYLLPKETGYLIAMISELMKYLDEKFDSSFKTFALPPSRSSIFKGIKNTTLIDSSYNATPDGVAAILKMFEAIPTPNKWLVMGDMIELGIQEQQEHEKLGELIRSMNLQKVILVGPRVSKHTYSKLNNALKFEQPKDALNYLTTEIKGGEIILFKGARFLEGIIEHLLADRKDIQKLGRRELVWQKRRKEWGL